MRPCASGKRRLAVHTLLAAVGVLLLTARAHAKKRENWFEVTSPHFVVVSNAGEKAARRTALQFEQIRAVFREVLPDDARRSSPTITVLALKNEASLRWLIPQYWKGYHARPAGIFSHRLNQFYIALDLSAPGTNPYTTIYHEYFHALTTPYLRDLPTWLAEGLADFYANTEIGRSEASVGLPDQKLIDELRQEQPVSFDTLLRVDHSSPYYNDGRKTMLFHAESWALTDYLIVADHGAHRRALTNYIAEIRRGASPVGTARAEFGDLGDLKTRVLEYMRCWPLDHLRPTVQARLADSDLAARPITEAEADVYRSGFLAVQGQPERAIPLLRLVIAQNPSSALAQRNLALALFFADRPDEAIAAATHAIAVNPHDAVSRYIRAYFSFQGTMLKPNPEMESDLRAAIAADPNFSPPYAFLAAYLAAQAVHLDDAQQDARKAVSLDPGNSMYQLTLAKVLGRMKRYGESHAAVLRAREDAINSSDQQAADAFLGFLERQTSDRHKAELTSGSRP